MPLSDKIQSILDSAVSDPTTDVPGIAFVAVDKNDTVLTQNAAGKQGLGSDEPMTPDTSVLWLASCTKLITAIAAMQLVEQAKLDLDDAEQLKKFYPEMASVKRLAADGSIVDRGRDLTLRMLLTHTTGFAYPMSDNRIKNWSLDDQVVIFEPGTGWVYGQSLDATGILIERVTGMNLQEYFQEHILKPLGVENLGFWPNQAMMDNLAKMHLRQSNGEIIEIPHTEPSVNSPLGTNGPSRGGGGCFGSLREYSKVIATMLNGGTSPTTKAQILKPETVKLMLQNAIPDLPNFGRQKYDGIAFASNGSKDLYPQAGNPPQGWSIAGFQLLEPDAATGKHAGTVWWAGLANLYWWMDMDAGVGGIIGSQVLPFLDEKVLKWRIQAEKAVYDSLK